MSHSGLQSPAGSSGHCCREMESHLTAGEVAIMYIPKFREYGIAVLDGGTSMQEIRYCPWCGTRLAMSLREKWFDLLDETRLEPESPQVPAEMMTDTWWRVKGL